MTSYDLGKGEGGSNTKPSLAWPAHINSLRGSIGVVAMLFVRSVVEQPDLLGGRCSALGSREEVHAQQAEDGPNPKETEEHVALHCVECIYIVEEGVCVEQGVSFQNQWPARAATYGLGSSSSSPPSPR